MNFILWILLGGVIGWLASIVMKTDAREGLILNVVVGIIGALVGGLLLAQMFVSGAINQNQFSIVSLAISLAGALVLLAIVNLVRRGALR